MKMGSSGLVTHAVVTGADFGRVEFCGSERECLDYLRQDRNRRRLVKHEIDLAYAQVRGDENRVVVGRFASYRL